MFSTLTKMWYFLAGAVFGTAILFYVLLAFVGYYKWKRDFSHRKPRADADCPSTTEHLEPTLRGNMRATTKSNKHRLVSALMNHEDAAHKGACAFKAALFRKKNRAREQYLKRNHEMAQSHLMATDTSQKLDMDHVYLPLSYFLWGYLMIAPSAALLIVIGLAKMAFRRWLKAKGIIKGRPAVMEVTVAKLVLETTLASHFLESEEDEEGNMIGRFIWVDVPIMFGGDKMRVFERLTVFIDLTNRRWRSTQLVGHGSVSARDTLSLMGCILVVSHSRVHSYANWAVDLKSKNAFVRRMSLVTVMYNYFGFTSLPSTMSWIHKAGLSSSAYSTELHGCVVKFIESGMHNHAAVRSLATCSDFVHFIVKIRRKFLQCFTKYTDDFPTTSGEALFIGTVLHGLDHKMFTNVVEDPIWFEAEDPVFQNCAEIIQIVRAGMVDDLPLIAFNYRYKNAGHPFYREMYKYAATLNEQMADNMDCCIIK